MSTHPNLDHFSCEIAEGRNLLSSWIECFGYLIPSLFLLKVGCLAKRVVFGAIYAIAGAIFVRIFWMLDAASLPSLLTVGYSIKLVEFGSVVPINAVTVR